MTQEVEITNILYDCDFISRSVLSLVFETPIYTDRLITKGIREKKIKVKNYTLPHHKGSSSCLTLSSSLEKRLCVEKGEEKKIEEKERNRGKYKHIESRRKMVDAAMMCCFAGAFGYPKRGNHYSNVYSLQDAEKGYYPISPFTPPHKQWNQEQMHKCIENGGIVINREQIRKYNVDIRRDKNHFQYSSAAGVFLTKTGPFMLYSITNGHFYLRDIDEHYMLQEIARELHAKGVYDQYRYPDIEKAFVFFTEKPSFRALIENRKRFSNKVFNRFSWMFLIPATEDGVQQIKRMIFGHLWKQDTLKKLQETGLYQANLFDSIFPLMNNAGNKVFYGENMDLITLREFYRIVNLPENQMEEYEIICFAWQVSYYEQVFGKNVKYIVTDEDS